MNMATEEIDGSDCEHNQNATFEAIESRLLKLSRLLNRESGNVLAGYGFSDEDLRPVNQRLYFTTLAELRPLTKKVILDYCAKQFANCTSLEGARFFAKHRLILAKTHIKLRWAGIRFYYLRTPAAAELGLRTLEGLADLIIPLQAAGS
jgi:hypothetical protein